MVHGIISLLEFEWVGRQHLGFVVTPTRLIVILEKEIPIRREKHGGRVVGRGGRGEENFLALGPGETRGSGFHNHRLVKGVLELFVEFVEWAEHKRELVSVGMTSGRSVLVDRS